MRYRKLKADRLFDGHQFLKGKVLVVSEDGTIENILNDEDSADIQIGEGILMPGFINCHCHLELSHMKGVVPEHTGLVTFLMTVIRERKNRMPDKKAFHDADREMFENGISGVADICNTTDAMEVKTKSAVRYHSLIETINLYDTNIDKTLDQNEQIRQLHLQNRLPAVLTPHAPYSVSRRTFEAINDCTEATVISVHNQETAAENELFRKGTGEFLKLYTALGSTGVPFDVDGKSSLQTWLPYFTKGQTILLVHNTFIQEEDILFAHEHAERHGLNLVYCLCPNANRYIEGRLPPIELLIKHNCHIVLGTDSYSSNWQLSIAAEINAIKKQYPDLPLEKLLQWSTGNAAKAMNWNDLGIFSKGARPGVLLLDEASLEVKRIF